MKKTVLIIMIATLLSKIIGFSRDILLSYFFGASDISDAYLISLTIPQVIFGFIGAGISTGYIPMANKIENQKGIEERNLYTYNLSNIILVGSSVIMILGIIFANPIVRLFASGFSGDTLEIAVLFTRISMVGIVFTGLIHVYSSFLQINEDFFTPAMIGIPLNIIIMISILLSSKGNIQILAYGSVVATLSQFIVLIPSLKKIGYKHKFFINIKDKDIVNMMYLALPVIAGTSVNQINILIDRTLASQITSGGISALNYASRLNLFIQGIFVISIATALYPRIAKQVIKNNMEGLKKSLSESINGVLFIVLPITFGSLFFSRQIITLLFGRGAFDVNAIALTASALFFYSIGMIGFGLREIVSRALYSMQDTKTPMINAAIGMILNIVLNIILSKYLGIGGLALATSIAAIFTTFLMFISLRKKIGPFGMKQISISFLKILFASLVMGVLAKLSFNFLTSSLSQNLSLVLAIGVGAVSYFMIIYFMKIEDVDVIVGAIKKKFGRGAV